MPIDINLKELVYAHSDISVAILQKGGTVNQNDGFEDYPSDIQSIPQTPTFAFLYVKAIQGATITITDGTTTLTGTATGSDQLYEIPNSGTWTATASMTGETDKSETISITERIAYYIAFP
jgi:hypothetical protein